MCLNRIRPKCLDTSKIPGSGQNTPFRQTYPDSAKYTKIPGSGKNTPFRQTFPDLTKKSGPTTLEKISYPEVSWGCVFWRGGLTPCGPFNRFPQVAATPCYHGENSCYDIRLPLRHRTYVAYFVFLIFKHLINMLNNARPVMHFDLNNVMLSHFFLIWKKLFGHALHILDIIFEQRAKN